MKKYFSLAFGIAILFSGFWGVAFAQTADSISWIPQQGISGRDWHCISFSDKDHGCVGGEWGQISETTDGGQSWGFPPVVTPTDVIKDLIFLNNQVGFAVGISNNEGLIIKTTDGGQNWNLAHNRIPNVLFTSVSFVDENNGWAASYPNGKVYHTTNGGGIWTEDSTGTGELYGCCFWNTKTGVVVGYDGKILRTTDGGTTWKQRSAFTAREFNNVGFIDSTTGWAVGENGSDNGIISKTTDSGITWTVLDTINDAALYDVQFIDKNTGWTVGGSPSNLGAAIYYTTDGGNNWVLQKRDTSAYFFESISIVDSQHGWVAGNSGSILTMKTAATTSVSVTVHKPVGFELEQNYPNPFNPSTTIEYSIPQQSFVTLKVYDLLGREVASLVNKELQSGSYKTQLNASNLASGVYLYRLNVNGITQTRKLTVMK